MITRQRAQTQVKIGLILFVDASTEHPYRYMDAKKKEPPGGETNDLNNVTTKKKKNLLGAY